MNLDDKINILREEYGIDDTDHFEGSIILSEWNREEAWGFFYHYVDIEKKLNEGTIPSYREVVQQYAMLNNR